MFVIQLAVAKHPMVVTGGKWELANVFNWTKRRFPSVS